MTSASLPASLVAAKDRMKKLTEPLARSDVLLVLGTIALFTPWAYVSATGAIVPASLTLTTLSTLFPPMAGSCALLGGALATLGVVGPGDVVRGIVGVASFGGVCYVHFVCVDVPSHP